MKIISFSSFPATWTFAFAEAILAKALEKAGHEVLFITPGNEFARKGNQVNEKILREEFGLKGYEIGAVLGKNDREEIEKIMASLSKENFENLKIGGINIGKIAMYEFLLKTKKMNLKHLGENEWAECRLEIRNTLISYFACRAICTRESPDRILMYNNLYSVNHVWEIYAESKGIPTYFLHHGVNMSDMTNTLIVARKNAIDYISELIAIWSRVKNAPVPTSELLYVTDHFLALLGARNPFVYSSPKSDSSVGIRAFFNVQNEQKIIVASMSSYDELFAAEYIGVREKPRDLIWKTQAEWISALIEYIKNRSDLFLIIRIHPREFPNKRDGVKSEHARMLEHTLKGLPDNVKVNWPSDDISLYDLALETNLFLNGWSSVGAEMSLLGIPVVIYSDKLISYPSDLNYLAENRDDYFRKIEQALKDGWSFDRMRKTFRWMAIYYSRTIIRLQEKERGRERKESPTVPISIKKLFLHYLIPKQIRHLLSNIRRERRLRSECREQMKMTVDVSSVEKMLERGAFTLAHIEDTLTEPTDENKERAAIRTEVQRIYKALYGHEPHKTSIRTHSLQYNLKQI